MSWTVGSVPPINGRMCGKCNNGSFRIVSHRPSDRHGGNVYTVVCTAAECDWQFDHDRTGEPRKPAAELATPIGKKAAV